MENETPDKFKVVGSKGILVKLFPFTTERVTPEGVHYPLFENYETEGQGRIKSKIADNVKWASKGEIVQISTKADKILKEEEIFIEKGSIVYLSRNAAHPSNQFLIEREIPTSSLDFNGYVLIRPTEIEAVEI